MITAEIKKWGNSLGLLIPKSDAEELNLKPNQKVVVNIISIKKPLKKLFGFCKDNKITNEEFLETRKLLESKWV
jgi:antitoxin component of MazEF toxin-antitoxin module